MESTQQNTRLNRKKRFNKLASNLRKEIFKTHNFRDLNSFNFSPSTLKYIDENKLSKLLILDGKLIPEYIINQNTAIKLNPLQRSNFKKRYRLNALLVGNGGGGGNVVRFDDFRFDENGRNRRRNKKYQKFISEKTEFVKIENKEKQRKITLKCSLYLNDDDKSNFNYIFDNLLIIFNDFGFDLKKKGNIKYGSQKLSFNIISKEEINTNNLNSFYKQIIEYFKPLFENNINEPLNDFLKFLKKNITFGKDLIIDIEKLLVYSISEIIKTDNIESNHLQIHTENISEVIIKVRENNYFSCDTKKIYEVSKEYVKVKESIRKAKLAASNIRNIG